MREPTRGWDAWFDSLQTRISYVLGVGLTLYESIVRHGQDPAVIGIIGFLLGFPTVRRADRDRQRKQEAS